MSAATRAYTTRRQSIVSALAERLKCIDGRGEFLTDIDNNVSPRLMFWDEIVQFPAIHINAGNETREYQSGGYKDRFLSVMVRCYVEAEDAVEALDALLEDVEVVLEDNARLIYTDRRGAEQATHDITILNIDTDEGALEPLGVGEILVQVRY